MTIRVIGYGYNYIKDGIPTITAQGEAIIAYAKRYGYSFDLNKHFIVDHIIKRTVTKDRQASYMSSQLDLRSMFHERPGVQHILTQAEPGDHLVLGTKFGFESVEDIQRAMNFIKDFRISIACADMDLVDTLNNPFTEQYITEILHLLHRKFLKKHVSNKKTAPYGWFWHFGGSEPQLREQLSERRQGAVIAGLMDRHGRTIDVFKDVTHYKKLYYFRGVKNPSFTWTCTMLICHTIDYPKVEHTTIQQIFKSGLTFHTMTVDSIKADWVRALANHRLEREARVEPSPHELRDDEPEDED
jgi:hypothetical protein